jgi:branched-chain amino acid transport system permease protein
VYYSQLIILLVVNALLALGAYLPFSSGLLVTCFGSFMGVGAILSAVAYSTYHMSFVAALLVGAFGAAAFGLIVGFVCGKLEGFLFAIATLGIGEISRIIVINSPTLGGALGYKDVETFSSSWFSAAVLICVLCVLAMFERSLARRALTVMRGDESIATALGISIFKIRIATVSGGAFLAGIAGGIFIHSIGVLDPRLFGFEKGVEVIMYAVVGGASGMWGSLISASVLTIIPEALRFSSSLRMIIYGACIVLVVILRPDGIWGRRRLPRMWGVQK